MIKWLAILISWIWLEYRNISAYESKSNPEVELIGQD